MPELPEVEALVQDLRGRLVGRAISRIDLAAFSALKTFDPPLHALHGTLVDDVTRHGKFLDIDASGVHLVIHLARAGWIRWRDEVPALPARPNSKNPLAARVVIDDPTATPSPASTSPRPAPRRAWPSTSSGTRRTSRASPAWDRTRWPTTSPSRSLRAILEAEGRKQIKGVMRMQSIIAGIGNAYSDEILHAAKMSPFKPANSLDEAELQTLYDAIRGTLGDAVRRSSGLAASELKGEKKSNLAVHGRTGQKCPVCGDVVREVSFADSSLQYCATCQTGGKPLADRRMSRLLK